MSKIPVALGAIAIFTLYASWTHAEQGAKESDPSELAYQQLVRDMNKNAASSVSHTEVRLPTTDEMKELGDLWPTIPPAENAAFLYARALAGLTYPEEFPAGSVSSEQRHVADIGPLRAYVDEQSEAIKLAKKACRMHEYQFPPLIAKNGERDWGLHAHGAQFRQLARVLDDAGFVCEWDGRLDDAVDLYLTCIRMGKHLQCGDELDALTGYAVAQIGDGALENLMASRDLSGEMLRQIRDVSAMCETTNAELGQVVKREFSENCWLVAGKGWDQLKSQESDHREVGMEWVNLPKTRDDYIAVRTRIRDNWLAVLEVPLSQDIDKAYNLNARLAEGLPEGYQKMSSDFGRAMIESSCSENAYLCGIEIRAAINLFVKDHAVAPQSLEQLCPRFLKELPVDPFNGKQFRYEEKDGRWKFWDVGKDLKDDGGFNEESKGRFWDGNKKVFPDRLEGNVERRTHH